MTSTTRPLIEAVGLHKSFGDTHALRGIDLSAAGAWPYNRRTTH